MQYIRIKLIISDNWIDLDLRPLGIKAYLATNQYKNEFRKDFEKYIVSQY